MKWKDIVTGGLLTGIVAAALPVSADVKIVERTSFDFSKMTVMGNPITPSELEAIKKSPMIGNVSGVDITIYDAGTKLRCDTPAAYSIIDFTAKTDTLLLPSTKQYMVQSLPLNQADQLSAGATASVLDEKQTKTILGHTTHEYAFMITNSLLTIGGTMWMAQDLPELGSSAFDTTNPTLGMIVSKVKGFPLQMDAQIDMPMAFGHLGLNYVVKSVSTDTLPASTFAVPSDYKKTTTPDPNALSSGGGPSQSAPAPTPPET